MDVSQKKSSAVVSDIGAWAMNVISSVGIIMANKQLMSSAGYAFSFATTLTGFQFAVTALVGFVSNASGYSASKHVPFSELLWFSVVANVSITGMNFSLMLNSVGFYQISKLSMIPVVCVMESILNNKKYSKEVKMSVVVVVIGVGVCTVTDVKVNLKGFICACLAVLSTSFQQIVSFILSASCLCTRRGRDRRRTLSLGLHRRNNQTLARLRAPVDSGRVGGLGNWLPSQTCTSCQCLFQHTHGHGRLESTLESRLSLRWRETLLLHRTRASSQCYSSS